MHARFPPEKDENQNNPVNLGTNPRIRLKSIRISAVHEKCLGTNPNEPIKNPLSC